MGDTPSEVRPARTPIAMNSDALTRAVAAYDEARCAAHGPFEKPMSDRNRETIAPMILAAVKAYLLATVPTSKIVPIKPTKAMLDAVDAAYDAFEAKPVGAWCGAASVYAAMLDAAPALESPSVERADATPNPLSEGRERS